MLRLFDEDGNEYFYEGFKFPDGQPHIKMTSDIPERSYVRVEARLISPDDIFELLMVGEVLDRLSVHKELDILYLMGGRMDRPIDKDQPFTLKLVVNMLKDMFPVARVLDPHSEVSLSPPLWKAVYPDVSYLAKNYDFVVAPDKGAVKRVQEMTGLSLEDPKLLQAEKVRDPQTGKLSGFSMNKDDAARMKDMGMSKCLIVDDLCDGGGTFAGLSTEVLIPNGAGKVDLFVTHGIFSKGVRIDGIDNIFTTNSYRESMEVGPGSSVTVWDSSMKPVEYV